MITTFGRFLRGLRQGHAELLKDMADKLEVSAPFLSAVESGKKSIPAGWEEIVAQHYALSATQRKELKTAMDESQRSATIDLANQSGQRRGVAVALARQFNDLSEEQLEAIKKAINGSKTNKR